MAEAVLRIVRETHSAEEAYTDVLADVGCNLPALDEHDRRVIGESRSRTTTFNGSMTGCKALPDSQDDVGGWEDYPEVHRPADWDTDDDGLPDEWEEAHGLNPNSRRVIPPTPTAIPMATATRTSRSISSQCAHSRHAERRV